MGQPGLLGADVLRRCTDGDTPAVSASGVFMSWVFFIVYSYCMYGFLIHHFFVVETVLSITHIFISISHCVYQYVGRCFFR